MKNLSQQLMVMLQNPDLQIGAKQDLFYFVFPSGLTMACTDGTMDITVTNPTFQGVTLQTGNVTFYASKFGRWKRGTITTAIGTQSHSCDLSVIADPTVMWPGMTVPTMPQNALGISPTSSALKINIDIPALTTYQVVDVGSMAALNFSGWAIAGTNSISDIQCALDGNFLGNATYGQPRPDIAAAYPGNAGDPNFGWYGIITLSAVTPGLHTISVAAYDSAGNIATTQAEWYYRLPVTMLQAIQKGLFDGAICYVFTAYMQSYGDTAPGLECKNVFLCGEVQDAGRAKATLTANDMPYILNLPVPSQLYSSQCRHLLYDQSCGVNKASFAQNLTITSSGGDILLGVTPAISSYLQPHTAQGQIKWLTGNNAGLTSTVRSSANANSVQLYSKTLLPTEVGDTCTLYAGCDRTYLTCANFFGNASHFGGEMYVPSPETVL